MLLSNFEMFRLYALCLFSMHYALCALRTRCLVVKLPSVLCLLSSVFRLLAGISFAIAAW